MEMTEADGDRFWANIDRDETGCWLWRRCRFPEKYGVFYIGRRPYRAHRLMWQIHHGAIPTGMMVCHSCDVRACCNPAHLFLGTAQDNVADMKRKGRTRPGNHDLPLLFPRRQPLVTGRPPLPESHFWTNVAVTDATACWRWKLRRDAGGYGVGTARGRGYRAHRRAWELTRGPIAPGLWVLHHCDRRDCCNPDHLFLGTAADNTADMLRKGRAARGARSGPALYPELRSGERNGRHKLTWAQVRQIRADAPRLRFVDLSRAYGVRPDVIAGIVYGKSWKDPGYVPPPTGLLQGALHHARKRPDLRPRAVLTWETVRDLRTDAEHCRTADLADRYGVTTAHVRRIVRGEVWEE